MDLQDQQEDRVPDGVDGGREGAQQDLPTLPTHVLAAGTPVFPGKLSSSRKFCLKNAIESSYAQGKPWQVF